MNRARGRGPEQLGLPFGVKRGGARVGAGRRARSGRRAVPHRVRPRHLKAEPVHVTLRLRVRSLRTQFVFPTVSGAIRDANRSSRQFRIVEFSVQSDHMHLIVEADDRAALHGGVRGLSVRLARRLNRLLFRRGRVLADRWHGRALSSPRAVRNALAYVFGNFRKHGEATPALLDECSSAPHFREFAECAGRTPLAIGPPFAHPRPTPPAAAPPQTWLLRTGWLRRGRLSVLEGPQSA